MNRRNILRHSLATVFTCQLMYYASITYLYSQQGMNVYIFPFWIIVSYTCSIIAYILLALFSYKNGTPIGVAVVIALHLVIVTAWNMFVGFTFDFETVRILYINMYASQVILALVYLINFRYCKENVFLVYGLFMFIPTIYGVIDYLFRFNSPLFEMVYYITMYLSLVIALYVPRRRRKGLKG